MKHFKINTRLFYAEFEVVKKKPSTPRADIVPDDETEMDINIYSLRKKHPEITDIKRKIKKLQNLWKPLD